MTTSRLVLDQALGLFDHHFGDLHVAGGGLVEGGADHFALDRALHVGDFFRALVDQQNDESDFRMVDGDRSSRCSAATSFYRCAEERRSNRAGPCRSA